jgi:hypothetical protein
MTTKAAEKELMHRVLDTIEQMLCEVSGSAQWVRCFPDAGGLSKPADGWQSTIRAEDMSLHSRPAQSAYFCLTSASALVDVTRSLLHHMDEPFATEGAPGWVELSELSKAAGQSAYLASVILAGPKAQAAASRAGEPPTRHHRLRRRAAGPQSSMAGRLMGRLMGLFDSRQAMRCN